MCTKCTDSRSPTPRCVSATTTIGKWNAAFCSTPLQSEAPALTREEAARLYESVYADYADIANKRERMKAIRQDAYYNALQIKYAYAVTCHKAQGGQWHEVYVDQGYIPEDMDPVAYLRWLYTAFTRTSDKLYLVNWPKDQIYDINDRNTD